MGILTAWIDGASRGNPGPAGIGVLITDEAGTVRARVSRYIGKTTNNQAEYKALIAALQETARLGAESVDIRMDSELVVRQVQGSYKTRNTALRPLFHQTKQLLTRFESFTISHVPREQNRSADALANLAIDRHQHP